MTDQGPQPPYRPPYQPPQQPPYQPPYRPPPQPAGGYPPRSPYPPPNPAPYPNQYPQQPGQYPPPGQYAQRPAQYPAAQQYAPPGYGPAGPPPGGGPQSTSHATRNIVLAAVAVIVVAAIAVGVVLANGGKSNSSASSGNSSDFAGLGGSPAASGSAAGTRDFAHIDVCSLLSQDDAAAVARAHGLNGAQTAATVYTLTATPQTDTGIEPSSSCKFTIDGQGAEGTVVIQVQSAKDFALFSTGTKVAGLGDEAYKAQGSTVVRVRDLMLSAGEDSFTDDFVVDLYRKMIPHLK